MHPPNTMVKPSLQRLALLVIAVAANLVVSMPSAEAAKVAKAPTGPKISATAKLNKKNQKLAIKGNVKGLNPGSEIAIYDTSNHRLVYSGQIDAKSRFSFELAQNTIPCGLEIVAGDAKKTLPVGGADKSCKTQPSCTITGGNRSVTAGSQQSFEVAAGKGKANKNLSYSWDFGANHPLNDNGSIAEAETGTSVSHTFSQPGLYPVSVTGSNADEATCSDAITVSVAPSAGNPYGTVSEAAARPKTAAGMPNQDGSNDKSAYVVFPFEEMGMEGGSQINIPFNPLFPYNAMNAQVIQKLEHKPAIINSTDVSVYYSAASNPNDPVGGNSINSTSQNLFAGGVAGANFDWDATVDKAATTGETVYVEGHEYSNALIAKTEFWDKVRQPNAAKLAEPVPEKGLSQADEQTSVTFAPMLKPDQGLRGNSDEGVGTREMPGIDDPYKENLAKPFDYTGNMFVAQNIPLTDVDDQGRINPYPLLRVEAKTGGESVAATDAVYTTASETGCVACHYKGEKGSDDTVWRTPVTITELVNQDGSLGPATGKGAFPFEGADPDPSSFELTNDAIADFKKYGYAPAIHNKFDNKFALDPTQVMQPEGIAIELDINGIRKDRVAESRWLKPDGTTSPTNPDNDPSWKLQLRLAFRDSSYYGDDSWQNREKAARWNTMLLHDYMTPSNYRNSRDDIFAEIADDQYTTRNTGRMCASHHGSTLKLDTGTGALNTTTVLSLWTRTTHAFHGKMQVYKRDVSAGESADGQGHSKGELIRDERGHPIMYGGRGWDPADLDSQGLYMKPDKEGNYVKQAVLPFYHRNNWDPEQFPAHSLGQEMLPVGDNITMEENCLTCHTGKTEKSYRDIHHAVGMKCDDCHGGMLAVGKTYPNEIYDGNRTYAGLLGQDDPSSLGAADWRRQWIDEPDCGSCHVGDANLAKDGDAGLKHFFSAGALKQAWLDGDKSAASMLPVNARFAVMPTVETIKEKTTVDKVTVFEDRKISQALYRKSYDVHGSGANGNLYCSTCHGGSHAIWPNKDPNANDNVTSKQLQGYDGNIAECSTCHIKDDFKTGLVATDGQRSVAQGYREGKAVAPTGSGNAYLAGPHGMHPIGDPYWYRHADGAGANTSKGKHKEGLNGGWHNDMAKKPGPDGEDQCAACHGADHKGTRLSRSLTDRELVNAKGKTIKIVKDQIIGCGLCHDLKKSFTDSPTGQAKLHAPPEQQPLSDVTVK